MTSSFFITTETRHPSPLSKLPLLYLSYLSGSQSNVQSSIQYLSLFTTASPAAGGNRRASAGYFVIFFLFSLQTSAQMSSSRCLSCPRSEGQNLPCTGVTKADVCMYLTPIRGRAFPACWLEVIRHVSRLAKQTISETIKSTFFVPNELSPTLTEIKICAQFRGKHDAHVSRITRIR